MAAFSHFNNLCLLFATFTCFYCYSIILNFAAKMEISIKEDNMTITVRLEENTVDEAIDAALVVISRIFSEKAVEEALKRLEW